VEDDDNKIPVAPGLEAEVEDQQSEDQINNLQASLRMIRRMHQKIQKIQPKAMYNAQSWKER
jgi:methylphosphotriester-DNA--protein-cysteine methyltransferase